MARYAPEPVRRSRFGAPCDGMEATLFTLSHTSGVSASVTDYGATLVRLLLPSADGSIDDCVLGFDDLAGYRRKDNPYFGTTVGRVANRIKGGRFSLGTDQNFELATNNGPNHLHGGIRGFDKVMWEAVVLEGPGQDAGVKFTYKAADGEEGYPGECKTSVTYTLTEEGELRIDMEASVTKLCPVNLANHTYFNLRGHSSGDVLGHRLHINAKRYTPTDDTSIPTGKLEPVADTAFDFVRDGSDSNLPMHSIGERIGELKSLPGCGGGYDHNFCLEGKGFGLLTLAATVVEPVSGRRMELLTSAPGVQFYSGNYLGPSKEGAGEDNAPVVGKGGAAYDRHHGFCLETQHFPDSINQDPASFPTTLLKPGELYTHHMLLRFTAGAPCATL